MDTLSAAINWHPVPRLRLGTGPAFDEVGFRALGVSGGSKEERKLGWVAEVGYAFINTKYFFSEFSGRYHAVGALAVDSMTLREDIVLPPAQPLSVTLPATSVNFRHWAVSIGLGFKIGS